MINRVVVLQDNVLALIVPEKQDIEMWHRGMNDLEITKYLGSYMPIVREKEEEYYNNLSKDNSNVTFGIYILSENKNIGNISLFDITHIHRRAVLGIAIFDKENQNKGYGTRALNLILKYAFGVLGLNKVELFCHDFNVRGISAYKKVGFQEVGVKKQHNYIQGKFCDEVIMEIHRSNWENLNKSLSD